MDQIFNELSVSCCYPSDYEARGGMIEILNVSHKLCELGMTRIVRTTSDFNARELASGYTIGRWISDKLVDADLRRYFLTFATKAPYIDSLIDDQDPCELSEFIFDEESALGLGLAHLWDGPSLSLPGDLRFEDGLVRITHRTMDEKGKVYDNTVNAVTLSRVEQVQHKKTWILERLQSTVRNGLELLERRPELFPHLSFCGKANGQIESLAGHEPFFQEIVRHFFILEQSMREWEGGSLDLSKVSHSGESESTKSNRKLKQMRTFVCQDGKTRFFECHTKIKSANKRIHFFPDFKAMVIHIGYVGDHLPTIKHGT